LNIYFTNEKGVSGLKVIDNIHLVEIEFVNVYLIVRDNRVILIDSGLHGYVDKIAGYIESLGLSPDSLKSVIITHYHFDHTGGLRELVDRFNVTVYSHRDEKELIEEESGVEVDEVLVDGDQIYGLTVIHTPGHTPGHICLLDQDTKALFIGDLVYEENGVLYEIPRKYSRDPIGNRESIKKLLAYDFKHILPSHGKPIMDNGYEKLRELVSKLFGGT